MGCGDGDLLIVTPICAACCSNAVADMCGEWKLGTTGRVLELGLGFSWYINGWWSRLGENNNEEEERSGHDGFDSTTGGQANHGGISGLRLKLWRFSCSLFRERTAWRLR